MKTVLNYLLVVALSLAGAGSAYCSATESAATTIDAPRIDGVFFAQYHVLAPEDPLFKLVGNLEALIKVQIYADTPTPSPFVFATLALDSKTTQFPLTGPKMLPKRPSCDPVLMEQSYDDSFTAMIPKEWVKMGLKVTLEVKDYDYTGVDADDTNYTINASSNCITVTDTRVLGNLKIGAPTRLTINMFDIHYFGGGKGADFPDGCSAFRIGQQIGNIPTNERCMGSQLVRKPFRMPDRPGPLMLAGATLSRREPSLTVSWYGRKTPCMAAGGAT